MTMAKWEIANRNAREQAVRTALRDRVTAPWQGTHSVLLDKLEIALPSHLMINARTLSAMLISMETDGQLDGWQIWRWRTAGTRMIALLPPGWAWDADAGRAVRASAAG